MNEYFLLIYELKDHILFFLWWGKNNAIKILRTLSNILVVNSSIYNVFI